MPTPAEISVRDGLPVVDPEAGFARARGDHRIPEDEAWGTALNPVRNPNPIGDSYPVGTPLVDF